MVRGYKISGERFLLKGEELKKLYNIRFEDEKGKKNRSRIWSVLCRGFFQQFVSPDAVVADVGAGYCDFINNISAGSKYAIDLNPDVIRYAANDVQVIMTDIGEISSHLEQGHLDVCFMSNFLEHISKDQISGLFTSLYGLLSTNGKIIIMTPNIKYAGGKYWDFFDHITPLTDTCLIEALEQQGYKIEKCVSKFLPYSTKSKYPQSPWIVNLYIKLMPVSGLFFGEQSVIIASKPHQ